MLRAIDDAFPISTDGARMSTDGIEPTPENAPDGPLAGELKALIDKLLKLRMEISSRLLDFRLQAPKSSASARDSVDISNILKDQIDDFVTESKRVEQTPANQVAESIQPEEGTMSAGHTTTGDETARSTAGPSEHPGGRGMTHGHSMSEKMQINTLDRINKALRLAKQGDLQGAYIHAELAESAMKMANEHMSEMEYEAFKAVVKNRLENSGWKR